MMDQFERTALMFGYESIRTLKNHRVAVFGIGGVGGHCVEALCRTGIGSLDLFDGDIVDVTNINRQIIATHKTVGRDKVEVMRERLLDINPGADIEARKLFYLPETADEVDLSVYDYIVDAVDTMTAKLELVCRAAGLGIPVISSMGAANKLDPTAFEVADIYETSVCPMARIMRGELRKKGIEKLKVVYSKEPPLKAMARMQDPGSPDDSAPGATCLVAPHSGVIHSGSSHSGSRCNRRVPASNAFVPAVAGLIIASEVVKDLLNRSGTDVK